MVTYTLKSEVLTTRKACLFSWGKPTLHKQVDLFYKGNSSLFLRHFLLFSGMLVKNADS